LHSRVSDFLTELALRLIDDLLPADSVTFRAEASGASSFIDHFAVTQHVYGDILPCVIIDNGTNLSDHCALSMSIRLNVGCQTPSNRFSPCTGLQDVIGFRWHKADLAM